MYENRWGHVSANTLKEYHRPRAMECSYSTLPPVLEALQPLRDLNYLTTFENGTLSPSAVTAVGTGNTPLDGILALSPRYLFFDAPLDGGCLLLHSSCLFSDIPPAALFANSSVTYDVNLSPMASTDYGPAVGWSGIGNISESQLANMTKFIGDAHSLGIRARFAYLPEETNYTLMDVIGFGIHLDGPFKHDMPSGSNC